ncbi:hypothetical protein AA313_de0204150 [Arthrobotrys entomopaga]|nr:hypothetical protein AA313_de0204150 [Arthrobotrys entomopaga]
MKLLATPPVSIYIYLLLLCLPQPTPAFWFEATIGKGSFFSRPSALRVGSGKPEGLSYYTCGRMSETYLSHPVDGVAVWNRPDSFPTLAFALYYGRDCIRVRGGFSAHPQVMLLMDPGKLRGIHLANVEALGIQPECKSWQAVKVSREVQPGGALYGLEPQSLPGSIVYWDRQGIRHVKKNGIEWVNAIAYEGLDVRRSIGMLLRDTLERYLHPDLAGHPGAAEMKKLMADVNSKVGVLGDEFYVPQIGGLWEGNMTLPVRGDTYDVVVEKLPGGEEPQRQGPAPNSAPFVIPDKAGTKYKTRGRSWLDIQDLDLTNIRTSTHNPEFVANKPVLKSALVRSFNRVPDRPEDKLLWYKLLEAQMTYNLRMFGTAARILWAWQQAWGEMHAEELAQRRRNNEGIDLNPLEEDEEDVGSPFFETAGGVPLADPGRFEVNEKEQMGGNINDAMEQLIKGPGVQDISQEEEMEIKKFKSETDSIYLEPSDESEDDDDDYDDDDYDDDIAYQTFVQNLMDKPGGTRLKQELEGWTMQNLDIGKWLDERIERTEREEAYDRLREKEEGQEGMNAIEDPEVEEEEDIDEDVETAFAKMVAGVYEEKIPKYRSSLANLVSPGVPDPDWASVSESENNNAGEDSEVENGIEGEYKDYDAEDDLALRKKRKPN